MQGFTRITTDVILALMIILFFSSLIQNILAIMKKPDKYIKVINWVVIAPLNQLFQISFLWFCFRLKLVDISIDTKAETAKQILSKIKQTVRKARCLMMMALLIIGIFIIISVKMFLNKKSRFDTTVGYMVIIGIMLELFNIFQIILFIDYSKMGYRLTKMLSDQESTKSNKFTYIQVFVSFVCIFESV